MPDVFIFIRDVLNSWAGYLTGGLVVAFVALWFAWRDRQIPRAIALALAGLFLAMAFYSAWHDQYLENKVGREAGQLAFESFSGELNRTGDFASPQLLVHFKSLSARLLKYHVESIGVEINGQVNQQIYLSRDGFVYAGRDATYRCDPVRNVPLTSEPLKGVLSYVISYSVVGSRSIHHTEKRIAFDLYFNEPLGGKFAIIEERED